MNLSKSFSFSLCLGKLTCMWCELKIDGSATCYCASMASTHDFRSVYSSKDCLDPLDNSYLLVFVSEEPRSGVAIGTCIRTCSRLTTGKSILLLIFYLFLVAIATRWVLRVNSIVDCLEAILERNVL